jgi:hypothetical protein
LIGGRTAAISTKNGVPLDFTDHLTCVTFFERGYAKGHVFEYLDEDPSQAKEKRRPKLRILH